MRARGRSSDVTGLTLGRDGFFVIARALRAGNRGALPGSYHSHHQSLSAGRVCRCDGPNSGAEAYRGSRPASHRLKPLGRWRQHRNRFRGEGGARRLHAPVHRARTPHGQPDPLQQTSLRFDERLCADRAVCDRAHRADRQSRRAREQRAGADRAGEAGAGQDQLRFGGERHDESSLRRAVQEHGSYRHRARAVSRCGTGDERFDRRARPDVLRPHAGGVAANRRRQGARASQRGGEATSALPNVPTVAEQGLPGFDASSWYGLVAPAKTPEPVLAKLRDEVAKALEAPDMVARIRELGSEPGAAFGKDFGAFMAAETKKWAEVIRTSGAKAD